MAATVLNSARAIEMSLFVVRAFLKLRDLTASHRELAAKIALLERHVSKHDAELAEIVAALKRLMAQPPRRQRTIGFFS